jgi:hypothetical protein
MNPESSGLSRRTIALLLSPLGLVLISAVRLIIVADYNTTTAVTIASSGGYFNTLLGSIIPLLPIFAPYIALILLLFKRFLLSIIAFAFAAFITPAPVSLHQLASTAGTDLAHIFGKAPSISHISVPRLLVIAAVLILLVALALYHRSIAEAVSVIAVVAIAAALVFAARSNPHATPITLQLANAGEHTQEHLFISWATGNWALTILIALAIAAFLARYHGNFPGPLSSIVAVAATLALFPYVYNIYPVPKHREYYVEALHQIWLPAERIQLRSGIVYYGYVLSESVAWFTVLLTNRTIIYLPVADVAGRATCRQQTNNAPPRYPPLVPLLYTRPPPTPLCGRGDVATTLVSIRSHGQSLAAISAQIHAHPWRVLSITNAHEHEQLPAPLRAYERAHNWNKRTPVGQYFWYYPPLPRHL